MSFPKDASRIHLFEVAGRRFVYDVNSCVFTEIDRLAYDVLDERTKSQSKDEIVSALAPKYDGDKIVEALNEMELMQSRGFLFSEDTVGNPAAGLDFGLSVSTICLMVAQDCNLNCIYCFAKGGTYGAGKARMSVEVAKRTVDFLVENSDSCSRLTLCFFGGEPLLNFPVIRETVNYALRRGRESGKEFCFNITTNGTMLTGSVRRFLAENAFNVIFSIDGSREIQDAMRPFRNGRGSYDDVYANLQSLIKEAPKIGLEFSIRATYTRKNHDICGVASHLVSIGCRDISVEPAVLHHDELEIRLQDLDDIKKEYFAFAKRYLNSFKEGTHYSFFHFQNIIDQALHPTRSFTQCNAGSRYLAVSSSGDLYPCHRFVGNREFLLGNVFEGIQRRDICQLFSSANVNAKASCGLCWARYTCGGGCHAYAFEFNGSILEPYKVDCELMKYRIELGAYIYAELMDQYPKLAESFQRQTDKFRPYLTKQDTQQ